MKKKCFAIVMIVILLMLAGCGNVDNNALHINYTAEDKYGTGDYLYKTVCFTGSELEKESIFSVEELETLAIEDEELGYTGEYSMLTRGSIFSSHEITGLKLYEFLLTLGLDQNAEDVDIKLISSDGYMSVMKLSEIKNSTDNTYESIESETPVAENVPVILAFGSDGVPLVGPVGAGKPGDKISEEEGFVETAENVGGPVRLIAGQKSSTEFNAPDNAKWISKVVVGDDVPRDTHKDKDKECFDIYIVSKSGDTLEKKSVTYGMVEDHSNKVENYYGKSHYYKGAEFWSFISSNMKALSDEGTVFLYYEDGTADEIDIEYFRNIKGDFSGYHTEKGGLKITNVIPALGYSIDCKPTEDGIMALLPSDGSNINKSKAKKIDKLVITQGDSIIDNDAKWRNNTVKIFGDGVKEDRTLTYSQLLNDVNLLVDVDGKKEISLGALLEDTEAHVDAGKVILSGNDYKEITTYKKATENKDKITINPEDEITSIKVERKKGQWTHEKAPFKKYNKAELIISGSEVKAEKVYTLKELEAMDEMTVRDSFGASNGINGYQGIVLSKLIEANLKPGITKPSKVTVIGKDGYETEIYVDGIIKGIDSKYQNGQHRDVIIAYSIDGKPLVKDESSKGYNGENGYGPMRLIVENQISKWVKNVKEVRIGD